MADFKEILVEAKLLQRDGSSADNEAYSLASSAIDLLVETLEALTAQNPEDMTEDLDLTSDEAALIRQMRAWTDGIPEEAIGKGKESVVYISLLAARAELYQISLRGELDAVRERYDRMHKLISPGLIIRLCKAWEDLQSRKREDEEREAGEAE